MSTQSGIVRNVPTTLVRLPADTLFTDGNRAFVAAEVPLHWANSQRGLNGNGNNDDNRRADSEWRRHDNSKPDENHRAGNHPHDDLIHFAEENRQSDQNQNHNNNNDDQWRHSQQYKNFKSNDNEQTKTLPFNAEQMRTFNYRNHKQFAERYRTDSTEDLERTDSHRQYENNEQNNRRY